MNATRKEAIAALKLDSTTCSLVVSKMVSIIGNIVTSTYYRVIKKAHPVCFMHACTDSNDTQTDSRRVCPFSFIISHAHTCIHAYASISLHNIIISHFRKGISQFFLKIMTNQLFEGCLHSCQACGLHKVLVF